jgi:TusA-related sulfurtransferase
VVNAAVAIDAGDLPLGGGLLALLRPALDALEPGGLLTVLSTAPSVREDLPAWCRLERHAYVECASADGRDRHTLRRGPGALRPPARPGAQPPFPDEADPATGFAPRGAWVEPGGPVFPFSINRRAHAAPPEITTLYEQAVAAQWHAGRDIPWDQVRRHPPALERAVVQVFTFLAENELAALYVPSRFVARVHPAFVETSMFLATQMADEARHIEVFLRRARGPGGDLGVSAVVTAASLHSLLLPDDFTEAAFLLSVLGEGTFLDLLRFVEVHAPDEATAEIARRARVDETRHVHFGLAHVRHAIAADPAVADRLVASVRRRAATVHAVGGMPGRVVDALTILAARGADPPSVARGHEAFRALLETMHEGRKKRLLHAGFPAATAALLSELHTPSFM